MATDNSTIIGRFLLSGTTDVQQRLGFPDSKGTATVEKLFDPMNGDIYNDFCKFMIQRIGFNFIHQQHWENPLKEFFKQKLYYGNSVSETMLGWIKGHSFDMDAEDQFKTYYPDGLQAFHSVDHEFTYPITVSRQQMRRALAEEYGLNQLVAQVMAQPMNADEYDVYGKMLELFPRMDHYYGLPRHKLSTAPSTKAGCDELLQALQQFSYDFTVPSAEYTLSEIPVFANPDELVLFIRSSAMAATNVQSLAAAYNLDKVDIQYRLKVIPDKKWPLNDDDYAILTTTDFFQCYQQEYTTTSQFNPANLATNYFLFDIAVISASPFVPIVVFSLSESEKIPTVTMTAQTLNLSTSDAHVEPGGTIKITPTLTGTITPNEYHGPVEVAPDSVTYQISAIRPAGDSGGTAKALPLNTRTYVDRQNVLHVQKSGLDNGDEIHLTATSTYLNPEGATTPITASAKVTIQNA